MHASTTLFLHEVLREEDGIAPRILLQMASNLIEIDIKPL
jgi:hypothetical protein